MDYFDGVEYVGDVFWCFGLVFVGDVFVECFVGVECELVVIWVEVGDGGVGLCDGGGVYLFVCGDCVGVEFFCSVCVECVEYVLEKIGFIVLVELWLEMIVVDCVVEVLLFGVFGVFDGDIGGEVF